MPRDFQIFGEALVYVKGGQHMSGGPIGVLSELGLSTDQITITPNYYHRAVMADDFGKQVAPEYLVDLQTVTVNMTLVHYDNEVLEICLDESTGGNSTGRFTDGQTSYFGTMAAGGLPMGGGVPRLFSGNHYVGVSIVGGDFAPYRFLTCYLADRPVEIPIGTNRSEVRLTWTAVPYRPLLGSGGYSLSVSGSAAGFTVQEILSSGTVVWDRLADD